MRSSKRRVLVYVTICFIVALSLYYLLLIVHYNYNRIYRMPNNPRNIHKGNAPITFDDLSRNPYRKAGLKKPVRLMQDSDLNKAWKTPPNGTKCLPKTNIVFLKMHKCGSSTVQNILFRYGQKHNLNFVVPPAGNFLGERRNSTFHRDNILEYPVKEYNIFCHHTRYNEQNIIGLMPSNSTFVTILRDPVTVFESMFTYYKYDVMYGIKGATPYKKLYKFLKTPWYFYTLDQSKPYQGHGKNPMLYDFGIEHDQRDNLTYIDEFVRNISERFDLVMITEYFYESLILFKDLMCWATDDIVHLSLNARSKDAVPDPIGITPAMGRQIRQWNAGDVKLYDHFNRTFWQKVRKFGLDRMAKEVRWLKERNAYFRELCIEGVRNDTDQVWHPPNISVDSFQVKIEMMGEPKCVSLALSELHFTDVIRAKIKRKYLH